MANKVDCRVRLWHGDGSVLMRTQAVNPDMPATADYGQTSGDERVYNLAKGGQITLIFLPYAVPAGKSLAWHPVPSQAPVVHIEDGLGGQALKIVGPNGAIMQLAPGSKGLNVALCLGQQFTLKRA